MPATLRSLRIRNLALVESLDWELVPGFSVVTGETGTGKSIIVGALKLVLGERADKSLIRTGADQCSVEALFELDDTAGTDQMLAGQGINKCEEGQLLLKRIFSISGGNRQFINGSQTTLGILKQLGDGLVDLHGAHDHQSLLATDQQLVLIDAFAEHRRSLENYRATFEELIGLRRQREALLEQATDQNLDLWRHQLQELESANPQPSELETLQLRYSVASNAKRLTEVTGAILQRLSMAEDSVLRQLAEVGRQLREIHRMDESTTELMRAHEAAAIELQELERAIATYRMRLEIDPEGLRWMEDRLNLLQALQRKHHRDETGLIELMKELKVRLEHLDHRENMLAEIDARLVSETRTLTQLGGELTASRMRTAKSVAKSIQLHLRDLGFSQAAFEIQIVALDEPRATGFETVEFLFAANPGEPLKPLKAVASSGEISRVMLAVKTALAQQDLIGLLIFDEIDANVGGQIAHSIGTKMRSLGETRQVLAITHTPQVAAAASRQFRVTKAVKEGRTRTLLTEVAGENRVEELARMLGGRTKSALEHARGLLNPNRR
ncbi:MAG: DNA repair protein RecN [Verrucomicrobia bacterium]|nr:DNA repair protein RecN [Verrucomicrobiota bacterium]MBV9129800.1 DNA repair protein RecN [Verrucomicrobiota bacterium]